MRLLNTTTFELHEFVERDIPHYAILSHRWEKEEVSFRDMQDGKGPEVAGFTKIKGCCAQAAADGWQHVWIDSCCIDKSSSAELSEAINSMFGWYQDAQVCYAYLSDVPAGDEDPSLKNSSFRKSAWFTRGWTLQELLAPMTVVFFNCDWIEIGTKSSLYNTIASVTGIRPLAAFQKACIAQKMSWLSRRSTTWVEDMAYCMMGLFGITMPPLYGEGQHAFVRLQLEILKRSDDESIFAWKSNIKLKNRRGGLIASFPYHFADSGDVERTDVIPNRPPFSMTNKGLCLELRLVKDDEFNFLALLNCKRQRGHGCLVLRLMKQGKYFERVHGELNTWLVDRQHHAELVYVKEEYYFRRPLACNPAYRHFSIRYRTLLTKSFSISDRYINAPVLSSTIPSSENAGDDWRADADGETLVFRSFVAVQEAALVFVKNTGERIFLFIHTDSGHQCGVNILVLDRDQPVKDMFKSCLTREPETGARIYLDRVTKPIGPGLSVSVSLRKTAKLGDILHIVDITTTET
jgi:hypothetical protein